MQTPGDDHEPCGLPLAQMGDSALMRRIAGEDEAAFAELVVRFGPSLFRVLLGFEKGNPAFCEDLLQEVWLKVWRYAKSYRAEASLFTFLYIVAETVWIAHRHRPKGPRVLFDQAVRFDTEAAEAGLPGVIGEIEDPKRFDPGTKVDQERLQKRLRDRLLELKPRSRELLISKYIESKTAQALVPDFGRNKQEVFAACRRAVAELRALMLGTNTSRGRVQ
jgi:RNA polymerase sigma factor (sigma-70 family)